jgi:hypothetical protein
VVSIFSAKFHDGEDFLYLELLHLGRESIISMSQEIPAKKYSKNRKIQPPDKKYFSTEFLDSFLEPQLVSDISRDILM